MAQQWIYEELKVGGMSCTSCEMKIENSLKKKAGIRDAKASYARETVKIYYDPEVISLDEIKQAIEKLDYTVEESLKNMVFSGSAEQSKGNRQQWIDEELKVDGMSCTSCEMKIENSLTKKAGIRNVKAIYAKDTVRFSYDPAVISLDEIKAAIERLDYKVRRSVKNSLAVGKTQKKNDKLSATQLLAVGVIIFAVYLIIKNTVGFNFLPQISQNMGYGLLFVVGLITSLHCVAMCGGINLTQCVSYQLPENASKAAKMKPSLMYNTGRVISYTVIGGIVGGLGSVISFSGTAKGIVAILAGVFMLIMGLNMLNIFPWLRKFVPHMPKRFANKFRGSGKYGPFVVGLFNGLMPCGPLQAMQIYALGTGSVLAGAASMLFFSLGTVPLMFGFGAVSSLLSSKFTHKMMKVSAMLVMVLGVIMLTRGFALSGFSLPSIGTTAAATTSKATVNGSEQDVTTTLQPGSYTPITVQKGIPVKWTIQADSNSLNGCNETIQIPQYNITQKLRPGDNVITFTPDQEGTITYTCWMGMIRSTITVVSDLSAATVATVSADDSSSGSAAAIAGGCCATPPPGFENGRIPTDNIAVATINGDEQDVTIDVGAQGYSPAVVVLQKGIPARIKFTTSQLNACNGTVYFPEYGGGLDLTTDKETPLLPVSDDFSFECGMGMLHGYVKVVDDIKNVDMDAVKQAVQNYTPSAGGGAGCCKPQT
ncbi:copper ion binding protein [Sporobacter termitidis DSM 10068]|uniref:Copper ion binding protein n=1 Tax=Sporobacter termitidis DSM 10068 TaxID=1123282 RepID=A0A1M5TTT7_9FIRM|nr:copper ion binding protein [Sporobacter termitidis]SHH54197.1 copper ion binding protein [Sporobacter termitidis DSM 10068]